MNRPLPALAALGTALLVAVLLILALSPEPGRTLWYFLAGPWLNTLNLGNMLDRAALLTLTGLGVVLAFRAGTFNLGGEGQTYLGAIAATAVLLGLPSLPGPAGILLGLMTAIAAGAALAGFSGWLKSRWEVDELISTFLLSGGFIHLTDWLITGPLYDRDSYLLTTRAIPEAYHLARWLPPSSLNTGLLAALLLPPAAWVFLRFTRAGFEWRISGINREFARYGGIDVSRYQWVPLALSGALHGLAGGLALTGTYHMSLKDFTGGLGWNGIAVALIAANRPLLVIPAAIIFSALTTGSGIALMHTSFSFELGALIQAMVFLIITARVLGRYRRRGGFL